MWEFHIERFGKCYIQHSFCLRQRPSEALCLLGQHLNDFTPMLPAICSYCGHDKLLFHCLSYCGFAVCTICILVNWWVFI